MAKPTVMLVVFALFVSATCVCRAEQAEKKLIPVTPAYGETSTVPTPAPAPAALDPQSPPLPTPRDQMYVFWLLGQVLSYPIDKAESFVRARLKDFSSRPVAKPASAPAGENPFEAVQMREIPPAPPILPKAARR